MKVAIMQPYFFPYIGYFQLISAVDLFIIYDNIKYTKKGWINRNRILQNDKDVLFSLPLKKDSDFLDVRDRVLSGDFNRMRLLNQIRGAYERAPYFAETFTLIEKIVLNEETNLFSYVSKSIVKTCDYLGITTEIRASSSIAIDHNLKNQAKVLALCEESRAKIYVNAIGGAELYSQAEFTKVGIDLRFLRSATVEYLQFGNKFVPWLSIVDVLMFNPVCKVRDYLSQFELIPNGAKNV